MARKKKFSKGLTLFLAIVCLVVGVGIGFIGGAAYDALTFQSDEAVHKIVEGNLQIHFMELGNKYTGDSTYIKAGDVDILIDAGSKASSVSAISEYIDQYVTDGKLEYVIVTHAHEDHYAGFAVPEGSLFDLYEVDVIIDFALTNQEADASLYNKYLAERQQEIGTDGITKHYTAKTWLESYQDGAVMLGSSGVKMTVLKSLYYEEKSPHENNYSVCTLFSYGEDHYLFTGDLEEDGEAELVKLNDLPEVTLYKAGHHGSPTSSSAELLDVIKPEIVCVCCCAGSPQYTANIDNQFPSKAFMENVAEHTDRVYVTTICVDYKKGLFQSMNGNIVVVGDQVTCSNDARVLKEWDEFFTNGRVRPDKWK